jgi:hypothetical protein
MKDYKQFIEEKLVTEQEYEEALRIIELYKRQQKDKVKPELYLEKNIVVNQQMIRGSYYHYVFLTPNGILDKETGILTYIISGFDDIWTIKKEGGNSRSKVYKTVESALIDVKKELKKSGTIE